MKQAFPIALCAVALGCNLKPIADGKYPGEPVFVIQGEVSVGDGGGSASNPSVGIIWEEASHDGGYSPTALFGDAEPLTSGSFPVAYTFSVYDNPPGEAIGPYVVEFGVTDYREIYPGMTLAGAYVVALDKRSAGTTFGVDAGCFAGSLDPNCDPIDPPDELLGGTDTLIWYVATPPSATPTLVGGDSRLCGAELTNPLGLMTPGFHLAKFCQRAPSDPCYNAAAGPTSVFNSAINLVDASTPVNISLGSSWWNPIPPDAIESCDAGDACFNDVYTGATPPPCGY